MIEPLVSVMMITYNHASYIGQAIEGVLRQKSNFLFELVIGEDCSTDGTREIVLDYQRRYPQIIQVITSDSNVGARKNSRRTMRACRGKHIAICEGDDYWTDPKKLQKQADYLEKNHDYGIVHADYDELHAASGVLRKAVNANKTIPSGMIYEKLLCENSIATLTVMARRKALERAARDIELLGSDWPMGDYPMWLELSRRYKIGYIDEVMATYRVLRNSASRSVDYARTYAFYSSVYEIRLDFATRYGCSAATRNRINFDHHRFDLESACRLNNYQLAKNARDFLLVDIRKLSLKEKWFICMSVAYPLFKFGRAIHKARTLLKGNISARIGAAMKMRADSPRNESNT